MGKTHQTLPLPHPRKRGLLVSYDENNFLTSPLTALPDKGTRYADFRGLITKDYSQKFKDYVYTEQGQNASNGDPTLYFAPPNTPEEDDEPYERTTRYGNHYWPAVLKSIVFLPDRSVPNSVRGPDNGIIFANRYYTRIVYIPPVSEGTLFTIDKFIYPTEPVIPQHDAPTPTMVAWDLLNAQGSIEECLHGDIIIPATRTAFAKYVAGEASSAGGAIAGQRFPATNFTEWQDYVISDKFEFVNGAYYRERITVTPPPEPELVIK